MSTLRVLALAAATLIAMLLAPQPAVAQNTTPASGVQGGPVLDPTQSLVSGGALQQRRPGTVVNRARARYTAATARVGQRFPLQELGPQDTTAERHYGAELLNSVLQTVFDQVNSFLTLLNASIVAGQGGGLSDLTNLLGGLTSTSTPQARTTNVTADLPLLLPTEAAAAQDLVTTADPNSLETTPANNASN